MLPELKKLRRSVTFDHQITYLVVAFVLLAVLVSIINPLFEPTDEIRHYRYVRLLVSEQRLPVQGQEPERAQGHHPPLFYGLGALLTWWAPGNYDVSFQYPSNPFWGYRNWEVGLDNKLQYQRASDHIFSLQWQFLSVWLVRWVNIAIGAITVWLIYRMAKRVMPDSHELALGATALVALNPQFIYLSAAINNDILATLMAVVVVYMCVMIVQEGISFRRAIVLGVYYGLALLTKLHLAVLGGVLAVAIGFAVMAFPKGRERINAYIVTMAGVVSVASIIAGWWFIRNFRLYGDLTGMNQLNAMWGGRPAGGNWWAIKQSVPYLWSSLWGRFGYGQIPLPSAFYGVILMVCVIGLLGWLRMRKDDLCMRETSVFLVSIGVFVAIVFYYILIQPAGAMGRFLFPALPAFVILVAKGWGSLVRPSKLAGYALATFMMIFSSIAIFGFLVPAVTYPSSRLVDGDTSLQVGDIARFRISRLQESQVLPGESLTVTVDWQPLRTTQRPYAVFVHVIDEAGVLVAQRDTWPGLGRAPTTVWDHPFRDELRIDLPDTLYTPNVAKVVIGLYDPGTGVREPVTESGVFVGDSVEVGSVIINHIEGDYPNALSANFKDNVLLLGYDIVPRVLGAGESLTLTTYWQVNNIGPGYRIFAQVLDDAWNVWGSNDGEDVDWKADSVIVVTRQITLVPETPPGTYPIQLGVFSGANRLPIVAGDGRQLDDRVLLGPIKVVE